MLFVYRLFVFTLLSAGISPASAAPFFEVETICRTAIASIAGRDPKIMQVTRTVGDVLFLTYVRPIDNFVWTYRCRIEGNRVVWAMEPGRWREDTRRPDRNGWQCRQRNSERRLPTVGGSHR